MYVETRTTATEVLTEVYAEVRAMAYRVINDAMNRRHHPTYLTRPMQREHLQQLHGAVQLARRVSGGVLPAEIDAIVSRAIADANESLGAK